MPSFVKNQGEEFEETTTERRNLWRVERMTRRHGHGGLEFNRRRQSWYKVVSIQVYSFELSIVSRTWRKELGTFTPKCFSCLRACYTCQT